MTKEQWEKLCKAMCKRSPVDTNDPLFAEELAMLRARNSEKSEGEIMTEEQKREMHKLWSDGCSDSDIEDFCERTGVPVKDVFHQVAEWRVPDCCKGCKHIDFYNDDGEMVDRAAECIAIPW